MTTPALRYAASWLLTVLLAGVAGSAGSTPAAAAEHSPGTPLTVSIDTLAPSTMPQRGPLTVAGVVTNVSEERWTSLNVYLLTSSTPITTEEELAEANASDPESVVGARLIGPGLYDTIGALAPGESTRYRLSVPRRALQITGEPGVYWLGVHVLGANQLGHDSFADGRARTFVPLMAPRGPRATLALVLPVKGKVRRDRDGTLLHPETWQRVLRPNGRLGRLLRLTARAGEPVTFLVDPAVLDAAASLAREDPRMSLAPTTPGGSATGEPSPSPGGTTPPSTSETPAPTETSPEAEPRRLSPGARRARDWLEAFVTEARRHAALTVPYGDLDVAATVHQDFERVLTRANDLAVEALASLDVGGTHVVAPLNGVLPTDVVRRLDPDIPLLLSDTAAPGATQPVVRVPNGNLLVLLDSAAGSGGPAPTDPFSALAMRQRILSEAAVQALASGDDAPLVVSTPSRWNPGPDWQTADFFTGLDVPWLDQVSVPGLLSQTPASSRRPDDPAPPTYETRLTYSERSRRTELPLANLLATQELVDKGDTLAGLLTDNDSIDGFLGRTAMLGSSTTARHHPRAAASLTRAVTDRVRSLLGKVELQGPPFVTMSSEEGTFTVTVINGLSERVTVGIEADTGSDELVIRSPEPVSLGPEQRGIVRLRAVSEDIGVHSVTLTPTTSRGAPLAESIRFNVRSSQVGLVIWLIMGAGAAVLFVTAGLRIAKRIRERRGTEEPLAQRAEE